MTLTLRPVPFRLSSTDEAARTLTITASTPDYVETFEEDENGDVRKVKEAIVDWSLDRFFNNPVILGFHNKEDFPLGVAEEVIQDERGLTLVIKFGTERANPKAEQAFQSVREGLIRTASVGFNILEVLEEEIIDGVPHRKLRAELLETSLVPVPADARALARGERTRQTTEFQTAEEMADKYHTSQAAKLLRSKRKAPVEAVKTDADDVDLDKEAVRLDFGTLGKAQVTSSGGARIPARFTRTGILTYRMADGTTRRELRHPDDVFAPESVASLRSATVTDNHPYQYGGIVDPDNWKELSVGHVEGAQQDNSYLGGEVVIQDGKALDAINQGDRSDVSAGYRCKFENVPGEYEGEPYDVRQRNIRYNHVAILPPGKGRAGRDVSLRLDSSDAYCVTDNEETTMKIKLDGKEVEVTKEVGEYITRLDAEAATAKEETDEVRAANDRLRAEKDSMEEKARKRAEAPAEEEAVDKEGEMSRKVRDRVRLLGRAIRFIEGEDEDMKMDSLQELSDREVMLKAIQGQSPEFKGVRTDGKDESDDYVRARFDLLGEVRADSVDALVTNLEKARKSGISGDPVAKAKAEAEEKRRSMWKAS